MNYYRRYSGDYQRDTADLSLIEHGVFTQFLDTYYSTEKPLPEVFEARCRICRATTQDERDAVKSITQRFFKLKPTGYHNSKADRLIEDDRARIESAKKNGLKGGRPTKITQTITQSKPNGLAERNPDHNPDHNRNESSPAPTPSVKDLKKPSNDGMSASKDPKTLIWETGVALLTKYGGSNATAKSFLGKFAKNGGETKLAEVIGHLAANPKVEPKAYIVAAMTRQAYAELPTLKASEIFPWAP